MSVLETRNVFYSYTKGNIILSGINAVFETGKLHVIIGPSGSGKTTLLSLLGGLDSPGKRENPVRWRRYRGAWTGISPAAACFSDFSEL